MSRFYKASNKRLIARAGNGRFRTTTITDIGMAMCGKCRRIFTPNYTRANEDGMINQFRLRALQTTCPDCTESEE